MHDQGYNLAYVKYDGALLREYVSMPSGQTLKRGDALVILSKFGASDWLNVIDVDTGVQGWVYKGHVEIYLSAKGQPSTPVFEEQRTAGDSDPEVNVKNDSDRTLSLQLGPITYSIPPNSEQTIYLKEGSYKYLGMAPGVLPAMGNDFFSRGYVYSWRFYIAHVVR